MSTTTSGQAGQVNATLASKLVRRQKSYRSAGWLLWLFFGLPAVAVPMLWGKPVSLPVPVSVGGLGVWLTGTPWFGGILPVILGVGALRIRRSVGAIALLAAAAFVIGFQIAVHLIAANNVALQ